MLVSQYNPILVVLSFVVAILAAYTALNMAARVAGSEGVAARVWLAGGGIAMGIGVWAMHFIGMLAMDISMHLSYDPLLTAISMLIAISGLLLSALVLASIGLWLTRHLNRLTQASRRLARGATFQTLPDSADDDVGALTAETLALLEHGERLANARCRASARRVAQRISCRSVWGRNSWNRRLALSSRRCLFRVSTGTPPAARARWNNSWRKCIAAAHAS